MKGMKIRSNLYRISDRRLLDHDALPEDSEMSCTDTSSIAQVQRRHALHTRIAAAEASDTRAAGTRAVDRRAEVRMKAA